MCPRGSTRQDRHQRDSSPVEGAAFFRTPMDPWELARHQHPVAMLLHPPAMPDHA